jgi:hypothetical protein
MPQQTEDAGTQVQHLLPCLRAESRVRPADLQQVRKSAEDPGSQRAPVGQLRLQCTTIQLLAVDRPQPPAAFRPLSIAA